MLPTIYKKFLKRLQDKGIFMYVYAPTGGCVDLDLEEVEKYIDDTNKFWINSKEIKDE